MVPEAFGAALCRMGLPTQFDCPECWIPGECSWGEPEAAYEFTKGNYTRGRAEMSNQSRVIYDK